MHTQTMHRIPADLDAIVATLFLPDVAGAKRPVPVVICTHGLTGSRIGSCYRFVHLGRRLANAGVACVTFDFRGCGESDGRFIDLTCQRLQDDLRAVVQWAAMHQALDVSRVGLCGSSFGAFTAARVAPEIPGLRALAFWAGVASPRDLFQRAMNPDFWALLERQGWLSHRGMPLGRAFFRLDSDEDDAPAALARAARPTLIFHGIADPEVPFEHAQRYERALASARVECRIERLEIDDHGMRDVVVNDRILDLTSEWLCGHINEA